MIYGRSKIIDVGCELVAIYNALKYLKKYQGLPRIILEAELNNLFLFLKSGELGTAPSKIGRYFDAHKIKYIPINVFGFSKNKKKYYAYNFKYSTHIVKFDINYINRFNFIYAYLFM